MFSELFSEARIYFIFE
uniref:Uncharacterized protein n=1 Tax=Anguilla anguilla TaxID=7936 RepID=A0A0E9VUU8_ANGAN